MGPVGRRHLPDQRPAAPGRPRRGRLAADAVRPVAPAVVRRGRRLRGDDHPPGRRGPRHPGRAEVRDADHPRPQAGRDRAVRRPGLRRLVQQAVQGVPARRRTAGPTAGRPPLLRLPGARVLRDRNPEDRRRGPAGLLGLVRAVPLRPVHRGRVVLRLERQRVRRPRHDRRAGLRDAAPGPRVRRVPGVARDLPPVVVQPRRHQRLLRTVPGRGGGRLLHPPAARPEARQEQRLPRLAAGPRVDAEHPPRELPVRRHVHGRPQRPDAPGRPGPAPVRPPVRPVHRGLRPRVEGVRDDRGPARRGRLPRLHPVAGCQVRLARPACRPTPSGAGGVHRPGLGRVLRPLGVRQGDDRLGRRAGRGPGRGAVGPAANPDRRTGRAEARPHPAPAVGRVRRADGAGRAVCRPGGLPGPGAGGRRRRAATAVAPGGRTTGEKSR